MQRRPIQTRRTERTKAALIEGAVQVLQADGLRGATVVDICRAAGVTTGALAYHFGSKNGLLVEVVAHLFQPFLEPSGGAAPEGGARDRAASILGGYWPSYLAETYPVVLEILLAGRHDAELGALLASFREQHVAAMRGSLAQAFPDHPPQAAAAAFARGFSLMRGHAVERLYDASEAGDAAAFDAAADVVARLLDDAERAA